MKSPNQRYQRISMGLLAFLFGSWLLLSQNAPRLDPAGFTNGLFRVRVTGPTGSVYQIESSSDFQTWRALLATNPTGGTFEFTDTNSLNLDLQFYRAQVERLGTIEYGGSVLLLMTNVPPEFGGGTVIRYDLNQDGIFEEEVTADEHGLYTLSLDTSTLPDEATIGWFFQSADGARTSLAHYARLSRTTLFNPASAVPVNLATASNLSPNPAGARLTGQNALPLSVEPGICSCVDCPTNTTLTGRSLEGFTHNYTPRVHDVELATGKMRLSFPITSFPTRLLGFDFHLHHVSLTDYDGPVGHSFSHSFNMMIVRTGPLSGQIITPDLRVFTMASEDGLEWFLPDGFFARLRLDPALRRWTLTHFSGLEVEFYAGATGLPGYPIAIREPNGNAMTLAYDGYGLLRRITTDLGQVETFRYNGDLRLAAFTDHVGRSWQFDYSLQGNLENISTPPTEFANISADQLLTDNELAEFLVVGPRVTTLTYDDPNYPHQITDMVDQRGATPRGFVYDEQGRMETLLLNGNAETFIYGPVADPAPLARLEAGNLVTRRIDREGNITDTEMAAPDGAGPFGMRRRIIWTETGQGNPPLRNGEPDYWEQRWLQECDCLAPAVVSQPFSSTDSVAFDGNGIPTNWPRTLYTYNAYRQVTATVYTDGTQSIQTASSYQPSAFGDDHEFSRLIRSSEARAFDDNPVYAGLNFTDDYAYDTRGNRLTHTAPTVTRGVEAPQAIVESWTYNAFGQMLSHTDPNTNVTTWTYYSGPSAGGDVNSQGAFGGYPATETRGAPGSIDPVTALTETTLVNALGTVTRRTDANGRAYEYVYNDLLELVEARDPVVTLRQSNQTQYVTRFIYDGARNLVMRRRSNVTLTGAVEPNAWIDHSQSFDAVNNLLAERVEVDAWETNDLVTRYAYDRNDDLAVIEQPEGNRTFRIQDERRLTFKVFNGVAPGLNLETGFPANKRAETLGTVGFVGLRIEAYDPRGNPVRTRDGRGYYTDRFFDFFNRQVAESDPNGNGWVRQFDDASNMLTEEDGAVSKTSAAATLVLNRTYQRFDEAGRRYQKTRDIVLGTDERTLADPEAGENPTVKTLFDPGSRTSAGFDANSNASHLAYDADDRIVTFSDALGNFRAYAYDPNSNLTNLTETEVAGPGVAGPPERYVTTFNYDELNRKTGRHRRGLNGTSLDHHTFYAYDSRNNIRLIQDARDNFVANTYDDFDRLVAVDRFDGDPLTATPAKRLRYESHYDGNGRRIEARAFSQAADDNSVQITKRAFDDQDRVVRVVYPDSDDPVSGPGNGVDGVFDREEIEYDANSNPIRVVDQRGVATMNEFDPGNRLTGQTIALPTSVPGTTRQEFDYDAVNRMVGARNNYARIDRDFDSLSRLTQETQSIRLDGSGFTAGWQYPLAVRSGYDRQSNRTNYTALSGVNSDLAVETTFDSLNRAQQISAAYFDAAPHPIAAYGWFGPGRVAEKILGNGARLRNTFDVKRRLATRQWLDATNGLLVGLEYSSPAGDGYDAADNARWERMLHDNDRYDHFSYDDRYEVTGVEYRSAGAVPPASPGTRFSYDNLFNRTSASHGDPFHSAANTMDSYAANRANEYTQITRDGTVHTPTHDAAGNATLFPVLPVTGIEGQPDVDAAARWDAFNCLFDLSMDFVSPYQSYRYDPFRRRIAVLSGPGLTPERRFLYDGWRVVEERRFDPGATVADAPSTLDRIYVDGVGLDEHLVAALDRDQDGRLGGPNAKNRRDIDADQEYYFLDNRIGNVMALLDADNPSRILEYYRYTAFGEAVVLPTLEGADGLEMTPLDLSDNFASDPQRVSEEFGNVYLFTGRRFDDRTGLYYVRNRYYEARAGRFLSRDPWRYEELGQGYHYARNNPVTLTDPLGLRTAVHVWLPKGGNVGHASAHIGKGEDHYVSFWPAGDAGLFTSNMPATHYDYGIDKFSEGGNPDATINIDGLDEEAMKKEWENIKAEMRSGQCTYTTLGNNCSTIVARVLFAGTKWKNCYGSRSRCHCCWYQVTVTEVLLSEVREYVVDSPELPGIDRPATVQELANCLKRNQGYDCRCCPEPCTSSGIAPVTGSSRTR
jgi:RHS repeat-associated protein